MAGSALALDQHSCHVRSTSMPSRSHPLVLRVEEETHRLKARVASISSPTSTTTAQVLCDGLTALGELYDGIEELLSLPQNQLVLSHEQQKKWMEEELDLSVRLLDMCGAMRSSFTTTKEHLQDLHLALRKRGDTAYIGSGRKAQKDIKNCLRILKQLDKKHGPRPTLDQDNDVSHVVVMVLIEVREITLSLFHSILSFLAIPREKKSSRWSFVPKVSRALNNRRVACEEELDDASEAARVNFSFSSCYECISRKDVDGERISKAQELLEGLEDDVGDLETGLECCFRRLIRSRVSLLNILSL